MFIVCFIHSFWTCGNQNQQCNYTFCCLCGTGSGQMLWWGQHFSWKVSINLLALLDWRFSPVDKSPPCKSSFPGSLLFTARAEGNLSLKCFCSPETICQITAWALVRFHTCLSHHLPCCCNACLTGHLHAAPPGSTCLPGIALGIRRNIRRGLLALLYMVSSCGHKWAEPTGKCYGLLGRSSGSAINSCACTAVCFSYIITAQW